MMNQFEVWTIYGGERWLLIVDTSRHDFMLGFHRLVRRMP